MGSGQEFAQRLAALERIVSGQGGVRAALMGQQRTLDSLSGMKAVLEGLNISGLGAPGGRSKNGPMAKMWGGNAFVSIDDIPGRAVPYDLTVDINIAAGVVETQEESAYISMDGPFIAVRRYIAFRSDLTFQVQDQDGDTASFVGRTSGRFRPISSHTDVMDAVHAFEQLSQYNPPYVGAVVFSDDSKVIPVANPSAVHVGDSDYGNSADLSNLLPNFPGTGRPIVVSPLSMSSGRSMAFDGLVAVEVAGANYQRQNHAVPTAFWMKGMGGPLDLAACDVFEPGDSANFKVTPLHPNNPAFGNIQSLMLQGTDITYDITKGGGVNDPFPAGPFPFLASQFDGHEGINDQTLAGDSTTTADRVTRSPDGIITIGYQGYKLVQPPRGVGLGPHGRTVPVADGGAHRPRPARGERG